METDGEITTVLDEKGPGMTDEEIAADALVAQQSELAEATLEEETEEGDEEAETLGDEIDAINGDDPDCGDEDNEIATAAAPTTLVDAVNDDMNDILTDDSDGDGIDDDDEDTDNDGVSDEDDDSRVAGQSCFLSEKRWRINIFSRI